VIHLAIAVNAAIPPEEKDSGRIYIDYLLKNSSLIEHIVTQAAHYENFILEGKIQLGKIPALLKV
jgi:hypothetical protein